MLGQAKHPASTSDSADAGGAFTSPTQVSQHMQLQQSLNTPLDSPFSGNHLQYNGSQQQRSSYSNPQTQTQTQTLNTGMNLDPSLAANQGSLSQQPFQMAQLPIVYPVQLKQDISGSHSIAHLGSGININCNKKNTPSIIYNSQLKTESKNSPFHLPISDPTLCGIISRGNQSDRSKANSAGYGHSLAQRVGSQKHTATLGSGSASAAALSSSVSAITSQCNTIQRMLQSRYDGQEGAVAASTTTAANSNSFAALSQNNVPGGSSNPQFTAISRPSVVDSYLSSRGGNMPMFLPGQQTMASTGTSMNTGHGRKQAAHNQFQNHNQGHNLSQSQSQMIPTPGSSGPYFDRVLKITLGQPNPRRPRPRRTRHKKPSLINTDISQNVNSSASQSSAAASSSVSAPPTFMSSIPDPLSLDPTVRPEHSYLRLITEAISSSECGMMSLQEIYDYIKENYVYFRTAPQTWQNSIRHNLSVQKVFEKKPRPHTRAGKGGMWSLAKDASRTDLPLDISISGSSTSASSTSFPDLDYSRQQPKRTRLVNNATNIAFTQLKHQTQPHGLVRHSSQQILHTPSYDQHLQFSGNRSRFLQRSMSLSGVGEDSVLNFNAKRKQECLSFQNGYDALAASYPLNGLNEDETINTMFQRRKSAMYASELGLGIQESFRRMLDMNEGDDGLIDSSILNPSFGSFLPGKIGDLNSSSTTPVDGLSYAHTMGSSAFDFLQNAPETASLVSHARAVTDSIDMSSILCDPIQPENNHSHLLEGADSDDYSLMSACKGDASLDTLSFDLQSPFARVMSFSPEYNSTGVWSNTLSMAIGATEMPHIMSSAIPGISTTSPTLQATSLITTPTSIISPRESELLLSQSAPGSSAGLALMNSLSYNSAMPFSHVHDPKFQDKTLFEATLAGHSQDPSTSGGRTESPFMFKVDDDTVCQAQFSALKPLRCGARFSDECDLEILSL